jgi:hypothetical protein
MREVDGRIVWSPRVPREKIRRLYEGEAAGLLDEDLLNDVVWAIWERCRDILTVTRAHTGEATCPRCESVVRHRWKKDERMRCVCGWSSTWGAYMRTYRRKQLHGGGSVPWVAEFAEALPDTKGARDKMLLLDRLINRWHWDLRHPEPNDKVSVPSRPTAINVIGGTGGEILALLDELAGFASDDPQLRANREAFEANREASYSRWQRDRSLE